MKKWILTLAIILLIILSNYYSGIINLFTEGIGRAYPFSNTTGTFQYSIVPSKGGSAEQLERGFEKYLEEHPHSDTTLTRNFSKNPLKFWNWYRYSVHPLYKYPYHKPPENRKEAMH